MHGLVAVVVRCGGRPVGGPLVFVRVGRGCWVGCGRVGLSVGGNRGGCLTRVGRPANIQLDIMCIIGVVGMPVGKGFWRQGGLCGAKVSGGGSSTGRRTRAGAGGCCPDVVDFGALCAFASARPRIRLWRAEGCSGRWPGRRAVDDRSSGVGGVWTMPCRGRRPVRCMSWTRGACSGFGACGG